MVRKGDVKRAKLYYLRDLTGKKARIANRDRGEEADQYALVEVAEEPQEEVKTEAAPAEEKKSESPATEAENTVDESK